MPAVALNPPTCPLAEPTIVGDTGCAAVCAPAVAPPAPCRRPARRHSHRAGHSSCAPIARALAHGRPFVPAEGNRRPAYRFAKRVIDVLGAGALLVVLSPLLLVLLVVLAVTTRGRPIFCQRRIGYRGRPFTMFKFRTMRPDAERVRHLVANEQSGPVFKNRRDPRVTRIGRFLRKTSLDETPQLVNVLLGQMSLVGPRPPIGDEVARYEPWQRRRLAVKPGLTCLWQVSGRSEISFEDWVRMDIWYVRNQGLATDLKLLLRTPGNVIACRGAY